ncbi:uncharacterized protein LOC107482345 [Arachis duranensis]|uniref:U6 snRNA phosphodiesterase n=1 Tax=Arachis duranensis TaxID=130453 RepID=A0A6P4CXW7_ARADU|nr:uncharacterized protein LOC107482345 [Arachis duranensis]
MISSILYQYPVSVFSGFQSKADRNIEWRDYNNDSEEEFESNYEVVQPNEDDDEVADIMETDVAEVTNALTNQQPFEEPSFMRALDLEAMYAPKYPENFNAENLCYDIVVVEPLVVVDGEFVVGMKFSFRESVIAAVKDYAIRRGVDYRFAPNPNTYTQKITNIIKSISAIHFFDGHTQSSPPLHGASPFRLLCALLRRLGACATFLPPSPLFRRHVLSLLVFLLRLLLLLCEALLHRLLLSARLLYLSTSAIFSWFHTRALAILSIKPMEALKACYGDGSSDSDSEAAPSCTTKARSEEFTLLPPPPISLLDPLSLLGSQDLEIGQTTRVRSFPHVDGNYVLHVYIPIHISSSSKKEIATFLKKVTSQEPNLHVVDVDLPLKVLCKSDEKLEQVALGREFHISLGRTVPIGVHQIDSVVSMLRQKLQTRHHYWIDFNHWEVFINDDHTRTFLSLEVVQGGLVEITKQIELINAIYKLHSLPEFYKDPRPHISLAWALGDISHSLKNTVNEVSKNCVAKSPNKSIFSCKFKGIECKIGKKIYTVCKISD